MPLFFASLSTIHNSFNLPFPNPTATLHLQPLKSHTQRIRSRYHWRPNNPSYWGRHFHNWSAKGKTSACDTRWPLYGVYSYNGTLAVYYRSRLGSCLQLAAEVEWYFEKVHIKLFDAHPPNKALKEVVSSQSHQAHLPMLQ